MSNLAPFGKSQQPGLPTPPKGVTIARYSTYAEAQRAVDFLSDEHFAVQAVTIVGVDLQMVERVTGRLSYGRVAVAGMASGAWFGLFVGLLISLFSNAEGFSLIAAVFIGAAFGLLFGIISYSFTGGRRDFTSTSQIVAGEYRVLCLDEQAGRAMQLLNQLPGGTGGGGTRGSGPTAPATVTPPPHGTAGQPGHTGRPAPEEPAAAAPVPGGEQPVTGPTYSEMIERKRQEERDRERGDQSPG